MYKKEILIQLAELSGELEIIFEKLEELTKAVKKLGKTKSKENNA